MIAGYEFEIIVYFIRFIYRRNIIVNNIYALRPISREWQRGHGAHTSYLKTVANYSFHAYLISHTPDDQEQDNSIPKQCSFVRYRFSNNVIASCQNQASRIADLIKGSSSLCLSVNETSAPSQHYGNKRTQHWVSLVGPNLIHRRHYY